MSSFLDSELSSVVEEVLSRRNTAPYPIGISYEKTKQGAYIWKVWLEHNGVSVTAEALEPSTALSDAIRQLRYAKN